MAAALPYPSIVFVPLDVLTAEELNQMAQNTSYLADLFPVSSSNISLSSLCDAIYPIGSVMIRSDNTNYSNFLGCTWQKFASGTVLVGMNASDSDFNVAGKTGGSKTQELRAAIGVVDGDLGSIGYIKNPAITGMGTADNSITGASVKSGGTFNHSTPVRQSTGAMATTVQPYTVVNYWKRTA